MPARRGIFSPRSTQSSSAGPGQRGWQRFLAGAGDDNAKVPREGIAGREFDATQRQALLERFVGNLHEGHVQVAMDEVEKQDVFRSITS